MSDTEDRPSMAAEADANPYRAPAADYSLPQRKAIQGGLRTALTSLLFVIVAGVVLETVDHETIVGMGPVLFITGLSVLVLALRHHDRPCAVLGGSAMALCLLIVFLINYLGWGPAQGDKPITVIVWCYTIVTLPLMLRQLFAIE
ncbi:MAG: hypothetical protein RIK87_05015 [Fuerstiella sp.]